MIKCENISLSFLKIPILYLSKKIKIPILSLDVAAYHAWLTFWCADQIDFFLSQEVRIWNLKLRACFLNYYLLFFERKVHQYIIQVVGKSARTKSTMSRGIDSIQSKNGKDNLTLLVKAFAT